MDILGLFPTPVGTSNIGRDLTSDELDCINSFEETTMMNGPKGDMANSVSSEYYVLDKEPLTNLKSELERNVNEFFRHVWNPENDVSIYITCSWLTWTKQNQEHHIHNHPNSFISGTFYVTSGPNDYITIIKEDSEDRIFIKDKTLTPFTAKIYNEPTPQGSIKMFPSKLRHQVQTKFDTHPRICLAFNTWLKGTIGFDSTELKL